MDRNEARPYIDEFMNTKGESGNVGSSCRRLASRKLALSALAAAQGRADARVQIAQVVVEDQTMIEGECERAIRRVGDLDRLGVIGRDWFA